MMHWISGRQHLHDWGTPAALWGHSTEDMIDPDIIGHLAPCSKRPHPQTINVKNMLLIPELEKFVPPKKKASWLGQKNYLSVNANKTLHAAKIAKME